MQSSGLIIRLASGYIEAESRRAGVEATVIRTELSGASDGDWHFVGVARSASVLALDVDDRYHSQKTLTPPAQPQTQTGTLRFGTADDETAFV